nr:Xaa-Pro peptidase family protein [Aeoliella straminimaris]
MQKEVCRRDLAAFLVSSMESIYYLTGAAFAPLERPFFLLVVPGRPPALLVPRLDRDHMSKAIGIEVGDIHAYREYPAPTGARWSDRLGELLPSSGEIGVEPSTAAYIGDAIEGRSLRCESLVERQRLVKSAAEIDMIRRAALYADKGVNRLIAASYNGAVVAEGFAETRHVTKAIIRSVPDWDALANDVLMAIWAAPRSAMPHSVPMLADRLNNGPHEALVLTRVNGYSAESERTFFTRSPCKESRRAFAAMCEARRQAFSMLRPGVRCSEIDNAITEFLNREGYQGEKKRLHRVGHGIGLGTHEGPWIADGSDDCLAENMVVSVEPGVYLYGLGGFRHSDTVLITNEGYERLTKVPDDLDSLTTHGLKLAARTKGWMIRKQLGLF